MADNEMSDTPQKIADNVLLLVIARVSMAFSLPIVGFIVWLGGQYLDGKFEIINDRVRTVEQRASSASTQVTVVNDRLIGVETKQAQESAAADRFQAATLNRLDRMSDSLVGLSNAVSALTAAMQTQIEIRRSGENVR